MSENNLVVLRGTLVSEPRVRELPSGSVVVQFDVTTRDDGGAQSVPVAWFEPAARGVPGTPGDQLLVIGSVRRRFFRAGGVTQSRTEVVADTVVAARHAKRARAALERARAGLDDALSG